MLHVKHCGIDMNFINKVLETEEFKKEYENLKEITKGKLVIGSSDQMSPLSGISEKFAGYNKFLEKFPDYRGKVLLIQVRDI